MNIEEYIEERVKPEIKWYSQKSQQAQKRYKVSQIIEICIAAAIPLCSSYAHQCWQIALLVGILGCGVTVIEGIERLFKWHETWIEYRTTCELLKYHLNLYQTHSGIYCENPDEFNSIFITNIETIISSENNKWKILNEGKKKEDKKDARS